jgi:SAM-dependent methyltransferase
MRTPNLPAGLDEDDYDISATVRTLPQLDAAVDEAMALRGHVPPETLIDLGCGIGGLTMYVADRVRASHVIGYDQDTRRLERAAGRGVRTIEADLNSVEIELDDASVGMALSFGVLEHVVWYDNFFREAARVLEDGAPLILAMPNLGSYVNRVALLLGYQPREVEVSWELSPGLLPLYRRTKANGEPLGHVHAATLGAMKQLLDHFGFDVVRVTPLSPDFGTSFVRMADLVLGRFPSLSRRFMILARRQPRKG